MPTQVRSLSLWGLTGLLAIVLIAGAWWITSHDRQSDRSLATQDRPSSPIGRKDELPVELSSSDSSVLGEALPAAQGIETAESRVHADRTALEGRVVSVDGVPINGAVLTWSRLDIDTALPALAMTPDRRATLQEASREARTGPDGRFSFDLAPEGEEGTSALWVTALGMEGNAFPIELPATRQIEISLSVGVKRDVRVVDSAGSPVAEVQVEQYCFGALDRAYSDPWKVAAAQVFRRTSTTDADGRPRDPIFSANGGERIRAWHGDISSETWSESLVNDPSTIELVLSPSFSCYGTVECADPSIDLSTLVIDAWGIGERVSGSMSVAEVRADGGWGPIEVPCRAGWTYVLSLAGPGIASDQVGLGVITPGTSVRQDFEAIAGLAVPVLALNSNGQPIAGARCMALWMSGQETVASVASTGVDGSTELLGVRPGWIQLSAEADGYSNYQGDWVEIASSLETPLRIEMAPSRTVRGRVLLEDEPVERFKIVWWTAESIRTSQTWDFEVDGSKDGSFELKSAPRQRVWLMASAEGASRSGFVRSEVDSEVDIVLELLPSCRATGRVVDAGSGEPIVGATVQLYMNRGNQYLQPRHEPLVVGVDGRFSVEGLAPGDNRIVVEARGFSRYLGVAFGYPDRVSDIGSIPMQKTSELALVLVGEGVVDPSPYTAKLKGTRYHGPIGFDVGGVARFEDVSPGVMTWTVMGPNGFERSEVHFLQPDADWVFEVEVDTGPLLEIQVVSPDNDPLPRRLALSIAGAEPRGPGTPGAEGRIFAYADDEGRAQVRGLRPGPVAVTALDEAGNMGAATHGFLEPNGSRIEVPWVPREHFFRVLDAQGQPVSEADVILCAPEGSSTWNTMFATNDSGEVGFGLLPYDDVLVAVKHPEQGFLPTRPLRLSEEPKTTTLRYGEIAGLDLLLLEGGVPSAGTQVSLFTGGFRFVVGDIASDGEGRLRWPNLAEGTYSMRVVHPGFWPGHAQVPTAKGSEPTPVTIYRSASAVLNVVSGGNSPLAGQEIEFEHVGLGEGPAQWAALGLLPSGEAVSDAQGRIELDGWPRGTYRWSAPRADGTPATGQFELVPGANPEIELRVP